MLSVVQKRHLFWRLFITQELSSQTRWIFFFCVSLLALSSGSYSSAKPSVFQKDTEIAGLLKQNTPTVIITHKIPTTDAELQFDPLRWGLVTPISWILRLLYTGFLTRDRDSFLTSELLEKFSFDDVRNEINLELKDNIFFHDGSRIEVADFIMTLKRAALLKPSFGLAKNMVGIREWKKLPQPLRHPLAGLTQPEGSARKIRIRLAEKMINPLELLRSPLLMLVPHRCVDLKSGELLQKTPPFSGKYNLSEVSPTSLTFRANRPGMRGIPDTLRILYIPTTHLIRYLDDYQENHLILTDHLFVPSGHLRIIRQKLNVRTQAESRFMALHFNSDRLPFQDKRIRQYFAREFRKTLQNFFGHADGSMMTRIMPGYVPLTELNQLIEPFSTEEEAKILITLRQHPPIYSLRPNDYSGGETFRFFFDLTLKRLGLPPQKASGEEAPKDQGPPQPFRGKPDISWIYVGLDTNADSLPSSLAFFFGDKSYGFFDRSKGDPLLQRMASTLDARQGIAKNIQQIKEMNRHLFTQSEFAVVANYAYVYFFHKKFRWPNLLNDYTGDFSDLFTP